MGRPKGQRDSKPRTRRTKNELMPAPEKLTVRERRVKRQIKDIARDLIYNDWYIKIGLGVSGIQLAVTFTYLAGNWWAITLSAVSAIGKAVFIEAGVWLINRTISHARAVRMHWAWQGVLWVILFTLMWISVRANVSYEWEKKVAVKYPKQTYTVNAVNVDTFLTKDEQLDAWQRGGLIPLLVFASIIIGRVMLSTKDGFEREETQKLRVATRGAKYRTRKKKEQVQLERELGAEIAA